MRFLLFIICFTICFISIICTTNPAYPGIIDIYVQFSANGCPKPDEFKEQMNLIRRLFEGQNYTFGEEKVRVAFLTPIGTCANGFSYFQYDDTSILHNLLTLKDFVFHDDFCLQNGCIYFHRYSLQNITISKAFREISLITIKENSSAALILFSDSTNMLDIALAGMYRQDHFDQKNFLIIPIQLPGGASLSPLATNKSHVFNIIDINVEKNITEALQTAKIFEP